MPTASLHILYATTSIHDTITYLVKTCRPILGDLDIRLQSLVLNSRGTLK